MNLLVTGGAGYVGSHCVKLLTERGHGVVVYDNLKHGHRRAVYPGATLIRGDLLDRSRLGRVFDDHAFDGVLHFAALLNVNESISQPERYYENNVLGSLNLVGEMIRKGVRRLVFSSSCAVYGTPPSVPMTEEMPKQPISPYGRTKWTVEMALRDCSAEDGLGAISLRYFNASGAAADGSLGEDRDPEYHLIPIVLQIALKQRSKVSAFGTDYPTPDGTAVRDYVHVEDLALAHQLALENIHDGQARAYNVGIGCGTSVREVIESARRVTGHPIPAEEVPRREGDPAELFADASLIRRELGWEPQYTRIDEVTESAWRWHRDHPNGYED